MSKLLHDRLNVVLVGPMGAGKTTIGRQLAKSLKMRFVDSDHEIEHRTGVDIPLIFELEGEAGFRKRESSMIEELTAKAGLVLATGGGAVLDPHSRELMRLNSVVVYLSADIDHLLKRTGKDSKRPLLKTEDPRARMQQLLTLRDPLYREVSDFTVDTGSRSVKAAIKEIVEQIVA
ncbi:MAG: shikimate kinase AroK [Gammaproteobacteria bacterium]|nr:shikimate kinase AroK [Gammaproteobacteria bacterium]MCF6229356.1 shikimate kinase AroK [Gammaproteobacteria bacterium]